jgi:hypothetical protein
MSAHPLPPPPGRVTIELSAEEALVFLEWIGREDDAQRIATEHDAERTVLCLIEAQLERALQAPFRPDYERRVAVARECVLAEHELDPF